MTNQSNPTLIIASVLQSFQMIFLIVISQKAKQATKGKKAQAQNSDKEMMNAHSMNTHRILAHGWQKQLLHISLTSSFLTLFNPALFGPFNTQEGGADLPPSFFLSSWRESLAQKWA